MHCSRCLRLPGSSQAPRGAHGASSPTSWLKPPSTPATPTSSARRSTARSPWADVEGGQPGLAQLLLGRDPLAFRVAQSHVGATPLGTEHPTLAEMTVPLCAAG